ncbi:hypothetical protein ACHHYP_06726 [Achlya hypogyna]|uniref:DDE Tnp4 domain-containing protein n=1 Tax=Achlya hypogyna TaxID=1202772 RepID=A0A1V9YSM1_ACHHY|nr:hypothetical protein ACHHYP_06726 [Achlya hypogyna]
MTDADALLSFRFDVGGIIQLASLLRLPETIITSAGDRTSSEEALAIVLYRLVYPKRYYDMIVKFGRSRESLCHIFNWTIDFLHGLWDETIYFAHHVAQGRLAMYAKAINDKGAALSYVMACIDGSKKKLFNQSMSRVRQAVEWSFGELKRLWAFIGYKDQNKIMLQRVESVVKVAMFLTTCHCCYNRGNQISLYFGLGPPTLEKYLQYN